MPRKTDTYDFDIGAENRAAEAREKAYYDMSNPDVRGRQAGLMFDMGLIDSRQFTKLQKAKNEKEFVRLRTKFSEENNAKES